MRIKIDTFEDGKGLRRMESRRAEGRKRGRTIVDKKKQSSFKQFSYIIQTVSYWLFPRGKNRREAVAASLWV